ncbi:MAG: hypothetical protein AB7O47_03160 [Flavobacteriales bacterium]
MKVTTIKKENKESEFKVFIDDSMVGYAYIWRDESKFSIYVEDKSKIFSYQLSDFDNCIEELKIPFSYEGNKNFDWIQGMEYVNIRLKDWFDKKAPYVNIEIQADTDNWEKPFSLIKMVDKLEQLCENDNEATFHLEDPEIVNNGFGIEIQISNLDISTETIYQQILGKFDELIGNSISGLLLEAKQNSLTSIFRFPEEIQVSCEQYLIYFSKFLEDLGINAKTTIEAEAQNTLFTVTPEDPNQALSQIRDALNIFLSLPEMPEVEVISKNFDDIAIQQLVSNVYHLKSQLILAHSIIQAKDATIQSLSFTTFQQRQLLESADDKEAKEEKVLDGIVTVGEYEGKGFKINLAEIFRRLKRKLK